MTKTPNPGSPGLTGVAATSSANAWAVGYYLNQRSGASTLIARWNGAVWKKVPSPSPGKDLNRLDGVAATSAVSAWAVGYYSQHSDVGTEMNTRTLIEHWTGTAWTQVPSPSPVDSALFGVAATSPTNIWAVGAYLTNAGVNRTLAMHRC